MASALHGMNTSLVNGQNDSTDSSEAITIDMVEDDDENNPLNRIQSKQLSFDTDATWLPVLACCERGGCEDASALTKIAASLWIIFEDPDRCKIAFFTNIYVIFLVLISAVVTVIETVPGLHRTEETKVLWGFLEYWFVVNFTIELSVRFLCSPSYINFCHDGFNHIDFVSVVPFYIELLLKDLKVDLRMLRILRLGRALRLMKLARYSDGMQMIAVTMSESMDALVLFSFILIGMLILCSNLIYFTERGKMGLDEYEHAAMDAGEMDVVWYRKDPTSQTYDISPFQSIPASFWWVFVTLTTVGYGDQFPVTYMGQCVGAFTQLLGVLTLALPLSIVGTNFHEIREGMREMKEDAEYSETGDPSLGEAPLQTMEDITQGVDDCDDLDRVIEPVCQALDMAMQLSTAKGLMISRKQLNLELEERVPSMGDMPSFHVPGMEMDLDDLDEELPDDLLALTGDQGIELTAFLYDNEDEMIVKMDEVTMDQLAELLKTALMWNTIVRTNLGT